MRQILSIFLTLLVLLNLFGFYLVFSIEQKEMKREVAESITEGHSAQQQIFHFDKAQFAALNWMEKGKEFKLSGLLYDVISIKNTATRVEITAESDSHETKLVETFISLFSAQQDNNPSTSPVKLLLSHFQQDYVTSALFLHLLSNPELSGSYTENEQYPVPSFIADKHSPPPQLFSLA